LSGSSPNPTAGTIFPLSRGRVIPGETFADIVIRSREQGAEFACEDLQRAIGTLEARDTMAADTLREAVLDGC
jgi:hypothetical protein